MNILTHHSPSPSQEGRARGMRTMNEKHNSASFSRGTRWIDVLKYNRFFKLIINYPEIECNMIKNKNRIYILTMNIPVFNPYYNGI